MKRSDLRRLISEAIEATPELKPFEVNALMLVGQSADRIAYGVFYDAALECGCPLYQAGLIPQAALADKGAIERRHLDFAVRFDRLFREFMRVPISQGTLGKFRGGAYID